MENPSHSEIPDFATLAADPEIAPLLEFEPARRKVERPDGWTEELQRELVARIADTGSPGEACKAMDKNLSGAKHLYRSAGAASFRQAWKAAIALAASRKRAERAAAPKLPFDVPGTVSRRSSLLASTAGPLPGQVMNERGEWEDEGSMRARAEEAKDSVCEKLLRARRLFLAEISGCPGKRAAFEILTELPIDWEKAKRLEPQPDEPWKSTNQRQPDMVLTAGSGWTFGQAGYGQDRMAELRAALNEELVKQGKPPVDWGQDGEDKVEAQSCRDRGAQAVRGTAEHHDDEHSAAELRPPSSRTPQNRSGPRVRRV
jgi:hypothetical protein